MSVTGFDMRDKCADRKHQKLQVDPPPDLALEVDVTRSILKRMTIYAALRVPEVWRFRANRFKAYLLPSDGTYKTSDRSRVFPGLLLPEIERFLARAGANGSSYFVPRVHGVSGKGTQAAAKWKE